MQVIELARDPNANLHQVVTAISHDPALSGRLLSLANTVFYAGHDPVEDIEQAVSRIGMERTLSLALGCSLIASTGTEASDGFNLERYWQRSLLCALCAKSLAESLGLRAESGALFTASLLQDIGMLALYAIDAGHYQPLCDEAGDHRMLVELENRAYEADHAKVGGWLARRWQLSERTVQWISHSHDRLSKAETPEQQAANCLIASGLMADAWLGGEAALSMTMSSLADYFGLEAADMITQVMSLQEQLPQVATLYNIALPERLDASQLMYEAKMLLVERNARLQQDLLRQQQEIEALRREQELLSRQVRLDVLTKLDNRAHLEKVLHQHFRETRQTGRPLSVIFIDLDRFKSINDRFGHVTGDEVLKKVAAIMRYCAEESGFNVGRYGGEEFLVVLPGRDVATAQAFAELLRRRLGSSLMTAPGGIPLRVTASYGIASIGGEGDFDSVESLLIAADQCMYASKQQGGDRITLFSGLAYSQLSSIAYQGRV